ncbi:hypothetical protein NPIL_21071 [Nephila pilipes]|uniref:Spider venom protein n=1 Tax=Nephila pilipes TaxID=299642 RepID=A0A8X6PCY6_NEPPI|nr:hypothetical protein NPIL_21071 [Nephila pilipes]
MRLILMVLGVLAFNKVNRCKANLPMIISEEKEDEKNSGYFDDQRKETLSSKDLNHVYDMAKNISHSKGSIIKVLYPISFE